MSKQLEFFEEINATFTHDKSKCEKIETIECRSIKEALDILEKMHFKYKDKPETEEE